MGRGLVVACGLTRRGAPARRALHSPSLHQRLREEGRDPSLAHFPPSQTRTLPRSRSLTPSLSRSHTRAHTPPRLPLSRPLSLWLLRAAAGLWTRPPAGAQAPAPRSALRRQDWGELRAAPRGKSAGCRGRGGRIAAEERLPISEGAPWPAEAARQAVGLGGRASRRRGTRGAHAGPPRAPSSRRGGEGGSFPRPNFPRRRAEPPLGPEPAAPTRPPTPPAARPGASGTPAGRGVTEPGANPGHRKGLGRGRTASTREPGPRCSRSPPPLAAGARLPGPSQRRGPGPGNTARRERVRAILYMRGRMVFGGIQRPI